MMKRMMSNHESYHLTGCVVLWYHVPVSEWQLDTASLAI